MPRDGVSTVEVAVTLVVDVVADHDVRMLMSDRR